MGTWGAGIYENDTALDAELFLDEALQQGKTLDEAVKYVYEAMGVEDEDDNDDDLILALASELLERGVTSHPLFEEARRIIVSGIDVKNWRGAGASDETLQQREAVLLEFLRRLPSQSGSG